MLSKFSKLAGLAVATSIAAISFGQVASAKQCIHNKLWKSGLVVTVDWYDQTNAAVYHNQEEGKFQFLVPEGQKLIKPKKIKSDTITAGFSSCNEDFATHIAIARVRGGSIAKAASIAATKVAGGVTAAAVAFGGCAVSAGVAVGTAGTGSPAAVLGCIASGAKATSIGVTVGGALSALIPDTKDIIYAGVPSHFNYINVGGTAFNPWYDVGDKIEGGSPESVLSIPASTKNPEDACPRRALKAGLRWNGKKPFSTTGTHLAAAFPNSILCFVTLPEIPRFITTTAKSLSAAKSSCKKIATKHGGYYSVFDRSKLPGLFKAFMKTQFACQLRG